MYVPIKLFAIQSLYVYMFLDPNFKSKVNVIGTAQIPFLHKTL